MYKYSNFYDTVDQIVSYGIEKGILHLYTGEEPFEGTTIILEDRKVINFGSCSYLGLEFDERLKQAAKNAVDHYGTQFSESRAYVSLSLYQQLQTLLEEIFEAPCIITPTTTLGHIANIPVMVENTHAVVMDQQVHNSVQTAVQIVKARGVHVELIRHNRFDLLEEKIIQLKDKYNKIWYMADGVYSMFGDTVPVDAVVSLMEKYPSLYCYVDDAHGMSIYGKHGRGFILGEGHIHPKMVIATSLNKAFASGGGVIIYGDAELRRKVSRVGGPLLSSGPMQPSALGAGIAAARIHLTEEIRLMQQQLRRNIDYAHRLLEEYQLPVISTSGAAIFFVGVSYPKLGHNLVRRMLKNGFYLNLGIFPTVPIRQTGVRFTITRLHSFAEIDSMVSTLAREFELALAEECISRHEIDKAFKRVDAAVSHLQQKTQTEDALTLESSDSIVKIDKLEWDQIFKSKGAFDWKAVSLLEKVFSDNSDTENNWDFNYLIVRNAENQVIAATFLTTALWKDDMLASRGISAQVEEQRRNDQFYLTSRVLSTGSLITEGEHFYLNTDDPSWRAALVMMLTKIYELKNHRHATHIMIRDFVRNNPELDSFMVDNGFFKVSLPPTNIIDTISWKCPQDFYNTLTKNAKTQLRKKVLRNTDLFEVSIITGESKSLNIDHIYQLYLAVKNKNLDLNTFALPRKYFEHISVAADWEIIQLAIKGYKKPCCYILCQNAGQVYCPMVLGLDYELNSEYNIYRQALYQVMLRAADAGAHTIQLGFSADLEKQKLGARSYPAFAYMHTDDSYNMEKISMLSHVN